METNCKRTLCIFDLRFAAVYSKQKITIFMFDFVQNSLNVMHSSKMIGNYDPWYDIFHLLAHNIDYVLLMFAKTLFFTKNSKFQYFKFSFLYFDDQCTRLSH